MRAGGEAARTAAAGRRGADRRPAGLSSSPRCHADARIERPQLTYTSSSECIALWPTRRSSRQPDNLTPTGTARFRYSFPSPRPTPMPARIAALDVTAYTATSAVGVGNAAMRAAVAAQRSGLRPNDFGPQPLATWIGRRLGAAGPRVVNGSPRHRVEALQELHCRGAGDREVAPGSATSPCWVVPSSPPSTRRAVRASPGSPTTAGSGSPLTLSAPRST